MPIVSTQDLRPGELRADNLQIYNGLDCMITLEVFEALGQLFNEEPVMYGFERALQAPALEMMLRGFLVDETERQAGVKLLQTNLAQLDSLLQRYAYAVWDKPLNPRSHKQLIDFFYGAMALPEIWTSKKGERKLSMDREALEKLEVYFYAMPIIATILQIRDITKQLEVLQTEIDADGRIRTSYNIAGTDTDRWCLPKTTEILTKSGWKTIEAWQEGEEIVVATRNQELTWESAKKVEFDFDSKLISVQKGRIAFAVTPDHTLLYVDSHNSKRTVKAKEKKFLSRVPLCGKLSAEDFLPEVITRICVMMQADGHILSPNQSRWHFSRIAKINRCKQLLIEADIPFRETTPQDGTTYIYVQNIPWLVQAKKFGPWVLKHNPRVFIDEIKYWDGSVDRNGGTIFSTTNRDDAEWVKTMAHLDGKYASVNLMRYTDGIWASAYRVHIGNDWSTRVYKEDYKEEAYTGKVYCAETSTGFFLIRHNGRISITGNSSSANAFGTGGNLQNWRERLRKILIADPGWKLCGIDLEQTESRDVGWIVGTLFDDWTYLDACEAGDLHTTVCQMVWPELAWTKDKKKNREVAESPFYRDYTYRYMAKRGGHGCLTAEHEVYTPDGWRSIAECPKEILIYSRHEPRLFESPEKWTAFRYSGQMVQLICPDFELDMTAKHRVMYLDNSNRLLSLPAERIINAPEDAVTPFHSYPLMPLSTIKREVIDLPVFCPTVSSGMFYTRYKGKTCVTGNSNYLGTPWTMARHLKVPVKVVERFQNLYFTAFPGIPRWHRWVAEQLQTVGRIGDTFGRERTFFGRPNDDTTIRAAVAHGPQSTTAKRLNLGLYRVWEQMGKTVQLLAQVHDAVYFQYRVEDGEAEIINRALKLIEVEHEHNGRRMVVPGEAKVGWNWGNHHDESKPISASNLANPNGLKKWKGSDSRQRLTGLDRIL